MLSALASHQWVADQMKPVIAMARRDGRRLSVADEAERIARHPECRVAQADIKEEILLLAVRERIPMELDSLGILAEPLATD